MSPTAAGRPLTFPVKKVLGFDGDLIAEINNWRRRQDDVPNFSDAVRKLIWIGLAHRKTSKKKGKRGYR